MEDSEKFVTNKKLTDWENEPTLLALKNDFELAKEAHSKIVTKIDEWTNLLNCTGSEKVIPASEGRSRVQPKLVRRQAEWRYSALSEPFLGSHKLFSVTPRTFEDALAAKQNELVINWQFQTKLNKVKFIDDYVHSTVDEGTCIVKLGWERITKPKKELAPVFEYYQIQDRQTMQILQQALQLKQSNYRQYDEQTPEELKAAVDYFEETQIPTTAIMVGQEEITTEDIIKNQPSVEVLNPRNVYIDPTCNGDLDKAYFIIVSFETTKADLLQAGDRYKNLDMVDWEGASIVGNPDHESLFNDARNISDTVRKRIVAYEYWGFYDLHKTGELVPFVATWIGDTIIRMELNPFPDQKLPFVVVPYLPVKRELYGEPDAEILADNQRILGAVTRGMIDLLGRSANAQMGFAKGMLDPLNKKRFDRGRDYEFNPSMPPQAGMYEHVFPEIPQSAITMVQMQNQEAEAITGVKSFYGGLAGDAYGKVATGIQGMLDAAAKREMAILRRLAKGMTEIGNKIIAMNGEFLSEKEVIRVTNKEFISINREDLKGNFDLEVDISTAEVDNIKAQDLGFMLQTMGPNMDPRLSCKILGEIADLKRMPDLAEQLRNWKPKPDPLMEQAKQLEVQKLQLEIQKLQSEVELNRAKAQISINEAGLSHEKTMSDIELNRAKTRKTIADANATNLDTQLRADGTKHIRDMEKIQSQAEGNQDYEFTKALLTPRKLDEAEPNYDAAMGYRVASKQLRKTT